MSGQEREWGSAPILLYVPVPHQGYIQFFEKYRSEARNLWLIGRDLADEFFNFHKEIREIDPHLVKKMIDVMEIFDTVQILNRKIAKRAIFSHIVTSRENISEKVIAKYFPHSEVICDGTIFLRYDEANVKSIHPVRYDRESSDEFDIRIMRLAFQEAEKSSDWWRHVGAVLVKNGEILAVAHNQPILSEHMPYILGNPRDFIQAGTLSHFSDVLHSEKTVFAEALRNGWSTAGADLYVSVFPCPDCAKLIAESGIRRCFFGSGHASLDGEGVLRAMDVELVYVPLKM